jgi:hypothetical protein
MVFKTLVKSLNTNALVRRLKNWRNDVVDASFRRRCRAAGADFASRLPLEAREAVCFTVAFNTPWVIDILTAAWARHCRGMTLVVIDNSSDPDARVEIARIAAARGAPYLALPRNPEWSPNRSHGIAMNWIYHNVVRVLGPRIFGFVDHDCFPIRDIDLVQRMEKRSVYGFRRIAKDGSGRWNLWAGFCFFRLEDIGERVLDFKHRIEFGLDTGGGNWAAYYRDLPQEAVEDAPSRFVAEETASGTAERQVIDGAFLHLGGASYRDVFRASGGRDAIARHLWERHLPGESPLIAST